MSKDGVIVGLQLYIYPTIDYTWWDDVVFQLMNTLECPMMLGVTDDVNIFNNQFYDKESLNRHRRSEEQRNLAFLISVYTMIDTNAND